MFSLQVPKPQQGRRFVIADVHGCMLTLVALIKKIGLTTQDQVFFLGDYIDRGNDSAGVIDFILNLEDSGYKIFALKGNHEEMFLEAWQRYQERGMTLQAHQRFLEYVKYNHIENLLNENKKPQLRFLSFMENLYHYFVLPDFYLVHAGFNLQVTEPFEDLRSMLWQRGFANMDNLDGKLNGKKIIIGHTVHQLGQIKGKIEAGKTVIPLDNGCYYGAINPIGTYKGHYANLCCLNLDSLELIIQEYIG